MKKTGIGLVGLAMMTMSSQAAVITTNDFESGSVTPDWVRVKTEYIDAGWYQDSGGPSAWAIADGLLQNNVTNTTSVGEGAAVLVVSHAADTNNVIDISFDYEVAAGDTLYVHTWGLDSPEALDGNWFANFQAANGGLTDNTANNVGLDAFNLRDGGGCGSAGQALVTLVGPVSGTYTNAISIESLAVDGVENAGNFEYYLVGFARNEDGLPGTNSVDNLSMTTSYDAPPPPPPPPASGVVWENDMSADPVGDGWVVRNGKANYSVADGVLSMGEGAWSTLLDSDPYNEFVAITKVELQWRTTSHSDPASNYGAGIWLNCDGTAPDYYAIILSSVLNTNDNSQTVKLFDPANGMSIDTISGFGTGMIDAQLTIDSYKETMDYILTDGALSVTGAVSISAASTAGTAIAHTLFTPGPSCEVDYVRLEANAAPDEAYFAADPAALNMQMFEADSTVEDSLDIIYNSVTNLDVTITISNEDYPGSFSVLSDTNQVVFAPGTSTLEFEFDRTVANLVGGQIATGLVTIAWSEQGGGESGSVLVPISCAVGYSPSANNWIGTGNGVNWGDAGNWNLARVPGAVAADPAYITDGSTVTVATNAANAFAPLELLTIGATSTLNVDADLPAVAVLANDGLIDINGGTFTIDNTANNVTSGGGMIKLRSGTLQTTATVATRSENYECAIEISGGTVNMKHQAFYTGGLTIIGDAATVNLGYINQASILNFELGENGVSTIDGSGTWVSLNSATINVDGTNYTGGSQTIELIKVTNLSNTSTAVNVTGFAPEYSAVVTQDMDTDLVTLTITAPPYLNWRAEYGVGGSTSNEDGDALNNLYEYGLGGNPTNSADIGLPAGMDSGADYMDYVHVRRVAATNEISYALALNTDLVFGTWATNVGYTVVGYGPVVDYGEGVGEFDTVTNRIDTTSKTVEFIDLVIEEL